jgi:hypothetical protein
VFLAPDAHAVSAAVVGGGLGGRRVVAFVKVPLAQGALVPSASGQNLQRPDEVRAALRRAVDGLGRGTRAATVVLPDGLARVALLALPADADAREFARFRLGQTLPWAASEAIIDVLPVGRGRVVAAAVRRGAVAEYEQLLGSAGLAVERVHLASLLALGALVRSGSRDVVHVVLGDTSACFAVAGAGRLDALISRRRDPSPGEADRLALEAQRAARLAGDGPAPLRLILSGSDSVRLRGEIGMQSDGEGALAGPGEWPDASEAAWLGGLLR